MLRIPEDRLVFLSGAEEIDVSQLQDAILFVMAKWSGASQLSFRALNTVLAEMPSTAAWRLHIADTDKVPTQKFMERAGDIPSGYGETYWLKVGYIVVKLIAFKGVPASTMRDLTNQLSIALMPQA